jgi:hypothetical protein
MENLKAVVDYNRKKIVNNVRVNRIEFSKNVCFFSFYGEYNEI